MKNLFNLLLFLLLISLLAACQEKQNTLFRLLPAKDTGIDFSNTITESDSFNILSYEYIYNGAGVGIADFNNDGLSDIFFSGNQVSNRLYLNQGNFRFTDVTEKANVNVPGRWSSGVAVVDLNNDGWMDIFVCATTHPDPEMRRDMLYVNQGVGADGVPVFREMANDYKIDFNGHSITGAFFDYDRDGDLDLYILANQKLTNVPTNYRHKITDGSAANNDRLFRNEGNGTFTDVTREAGIVYEGFGLGLSISDLNGDGWPDIYVSNDFLSNDLLYINNRNGTFTNKMTELIGHQSQFSMGNDAADINNDGMPDVVTLDMLPETHHRKKTTIGNKSYLTYINNEKFGYEHQYTRNMLHLNNGAGQRVQFSEVGQLAGIHQTEWSWSALFADFDNDGFKDLAVTNGFPKDITDKDFANYRANIGHLATNSYLIDSIPVIKIPNYIFRNNGDLTFSDVTKAWGLGVPSFSNGAAFADLDNDGDLDYIVNNINDPAFVFENTLYKTDEKKKKDHFLRIKLNGSASNVCAVGAKAYLYHREQMQFLENYPYRGFLSSVEATLHFGLGVSDHIDSVRVEWPDGTRQTLKELPVDHLVIITYAPEGNVTNPVSLTQQKVVKNVEIALELMFRHTEDDFIDYNIQRTVPHKFSQLGPGVAIGDVNKDGLEDVVIGGSVKMPPTVFVQQRNGTFLQQNDKITTTEKREEDEGLLLFDADLDGDLDLYIVSGSIETFRIGDYFQDRLYINNGAGKFSQADDSFLPVMKSSGSCVRAADYDGDGDLDLLVGGRVQAGSYPFAGETYLLRNDGIRFTDVTDAVCPGLKHSGMVTDMLWTDFNNDGRIDIVVTGEFMPVTFYENEGNTFLKISDTGLESYKGWWNSIVAADFDQDGDIDYIAGNHGINNAYQVTQKYPLKIFAKDFDDNGSVDPILACYMRESMQNESKKLYAVHFWDELNSQSPKFRNRFLKYKYYGQATIDDVITPEEQKDALVLEANHMATSYIENLGNGKFRLKELPILVQVAPVNGMVVDDVNHDGNLDVLMVGNDYGNEVFAGRYDAFTGLVLLGDGRGNFTVVPSAESGFYVPGDAKALVRLTGAKNDLYIASQNRDSLKVFAPVKPPTTFLFKPQALDAWAELVYHDGKKQKVEFYYGSGYLSQSTRAFRVPRNVKEMIVYDSRGNSRKVVPSGI